MIALINKLLDWFKALFWKEEMELTLVGLQYSGKTTFVNVIAVRVKLCCSIGDFHCFPAGLSSIIIIAHHSHQTYSKPERHTGPTQPLY